MVLNGRCVMWFPLCLLAKATPLMAKLSASEPPPVKTISLSSAPSGSAVACTIERRALPARAVDGGRIAVLLCKVGQHRLQDFWTDRCRRCVVQIYHRFNRLKPPHDEWLETSGILAQSARVVESSTSVMLSRKRSQSSLVAHASKRSCRVDPILHTLHRSDGPFRTRIICPILIHPAGRPARTLPGRPAHY